MTINFSMRRILRAYEGFEEVYQGQSLANPICLCDTTITPDGRDPGASRAFGDLTREAANKHSVANLSGNTTQFDPWLEAGFDTPLGGTIILYLPNFSVASTKDEAPVAVYPRYTLTWRLKIPEQFSTQPGNFHSTRELGQDATSPYSAGGGTGGVTFEGAARNRLSIPAAVSTYAYPQAKSTIVPSEGSNTVINANRLTPGTNLGYQLGGLYPNLTYPGNATPAPVRGLLGQGLLPSSVLNPPTSFAAYMDACLGDECVLTMSFDPADFDAGAVYDFETNASNVSFYFGRNLGRSPVGAIPGLGAYAVTGARG